MENFGTALLLMVVGMATVIVILLLIIFIGKLLILFVNKYVPEEIITPKQQTQSPAAIPSHVLAAITSAVSVVTQGKGKITKVEKI